MDKIDSEALFLSWIDRYQNLILSICYKMTQDYFAAQDLTQETFLSAFQHLQRFDGENEKAWLCRIASNKCIDYLRQSGRRQIPTEDIYMDEYRSETGSPEQEALEEGVRRELLENCKKLKPPYNEIAYQYFYLEKKPDEIALEQRKNRKTVQTQIYRARNMMRQIYRGENKKADRKNLLESQERKLSGAGSGKEMQDG